MKKIIALILAVVSMLSCLTGCSFRFGNFMFGDDPQDIFDTISDFGGLTRGNYENYSIFTFDDFDGNGEQSFKMERIGLGDGQIYYSANLTKGTIVVKYDAGVSSPSEDLVILSAGGDMPVSGTGGYVNCDEVYIIFEINGLVSGEVIISFVPIT